VIFSLENISFQSFKNRIIILQKQSGLIFSVATHKISTK